MIARSSPNLPDYLWHHHVHTQKAKESLYFWRIGFDPIYERDVVKDAIRAACDQYEVTGIVVYELLGIYDLLLRIWLPDGCEFDGFHKTLTQELTPAGLSMLDPFQVSYMIRHWPFFGEDGQLGPEEAAIHKLQPETIEMIENGFEKVDRALLVDLEKSRLLASTNGDGTNAGIKFMMTVSGAKDLPPEEMYNLESKVVDILDGATAIEQRSLYAGNGFGHFLIMGRAGYDADSYHAIQSQLIAQLNAADLRERFHTRTVTHLGGQRGYSIVSERLSGQGQENGQGLVLSKPPETDGELAVGSIYADRFEIREPLGGGGFAEVYRAFDLYEKVERAVKVFKSSNPAVAFREIAVLRKIEHPNVVKLYWGDRHGSSWFMVCEFIEGRNLSEIEDLSPKQALSIVIQVLVALEAVHPNDARIAELERMAREAEEISQADYDELERLKSSGIIHRDVKPDNIMIGDDERVVLVDFNIASPARDPSKTGSGTPEYFAPDAGLDFWEPADDIFACGVVLYRLLTGEHPYPNKRPVAGTEPTDPQTYAPDMRDELAAILVKACSPLREGRYATAREMRLALEAELRILKTDTESGRITQNLKARRDELGMSTEELARASRIDKEKISRIESGDTQPQLGELFRMTWALRSEFDNMPEEGKEREQEAAEDGDGRPPGVSRGRDDPGTARRS